MSSRRPGPGGRIILKPGDVLRNASRAEHVDDIVAIGPLDDHGIGLDIPGSAADRGANHQMALEVRPAHDPVREYGFSLILVGALSLAVNFPSGH